MTFGIWTHSHFALSIVLNSVLIYNSAVYKQHTTSFAKLKTRNFGLKKQRKEDGDLTADEENQYQTNLTLMKDLKRRILRVSPTLCSIS